MSRIGVVMLTLLSILACVLFGAGVFIVNKTSAKYDVTLTPSKQQRVQDCDMPQGWKIITDGKRFSWETASGYRSLLTFNSPLEACIKANETRGVFKHNWKYLK